MKLRRQTLAAIRRSAQLAVALTLPAAFAVPSPASAQSEEGADVVRYSVCYPFQYGKICYDVRTVTHEQETPSGTVGVINGRTTFEMQGTGPLAHCKHYGDEQFHQHYRIVDGEFQQTGGRVSDSFVISCEGERIRCSNTYTFQYANREVRLDRVNNACQQPA